VQHNSLLKIHFIMDPISILLTYGWIPLLLIALISYKFILRVFFGMVIVPEDRLGLVTKKFVLFGDNKELPNGKIIATKGEAGYQANTLAPGLYFGMWFWQYDITMQPFTIVEQGMIGLVMAKDGREIPTGHILARKVVSDNYQDAEAFLQNGGQKGRQSNYITAGSYRINTFLFDVTMVAMTQIHDNMVGIITTLDGEPIAAGQIAGRVVAGHNSFQDMDAFLDKGGFKGFAIAGNFSG
jgi:uncharacterized membrane protein YqiK